MALSFKKSIQKTAVPTNDIKTLEAPIAPMAIAVDGIDTLAFVDAGFTRSDKYVWIDNYEDTDYSTIDSNRNITVSGTQANVTQENNGQIVPFEMPRYYDGIDLMQMTIQVHYLNADNEENYAAPINVSYSDSKIHFGWLLSDNATAKDGTLSFELMASGAVTIPNSGTTKSYLWRSQPNGKLTVIKSLAGKKMTDPTGDDWYTSFLATMTQKVGEAQAAADSAKQSAQNAQDAVASIAKNYYNKSEVDGFVNLLKDQLDDVSGLANFDVKYTPETQVIQFMNGQTEIKRITLTTDPSAAWVTSYNKTVDARISDALSPVQAELDETKQTVTDLKTEIGDLPTTLQTDYYNKEATDALLDKKADKTSIEGFTNELGTVKKNIETVQSTVDTANADIAEIQETLKSFKPDENSGREYDITYEDSKLSLLENGGVKTTVIIQGGGGGTGGTSTITIERLDGSSLTVISGDAAVINFNFTSVDNSGDDTGNATGVWYVGNTKVATQTIVQGKNSFDITQYLHSGDNTVKLQVTDSVGSMGTKNWSINIVEFYLESIFDDTLTYSGDVTFRFTPYGNISKTIIFTLDGL